MIGYFNILSGEYTSPSNAFCPSGVTKTAVNIHFTNRTSGEVNFPTGNFINTLFHPFCRRTSKGGRTTQFSLPKVISLLLVRWVAVHTGGNTSCSFIQMRLSL